MITSHLHLILIGRSGMYHPEKMAPEAGLVSKEIQAANARRWGVGGPAEETFCRPNQIDLLVGLPLFVVCCRQSILTTMILIQMDDLFH